MKKVNKKELIHKDMTFHEILTKFPKTGPIFMKHQMFCAMGCPMAMQETLEEGCLAHGIEINKVLKELNKKLKNKLK